MVRAANPKDIAALVALGARMHAESPVFSRHAYLPERVAANMAAVMAHEHGFAVVAEFRGEIVGGLVAAAVPHFACDFLQAGDLALFIAPEARGGAIAAQLVRAYLKWCDQIGAEPSISVNTGVHPQRTGELLCALGAEQSGQNYTWRTPCA
jgi:GNAT superfamily N-acetyltransferase